MEYEAIQSVELETQRGIEHTISRAFLIAQLLTRSAGQAESAVVEALDSWDPAGESEEVLLERVLAAGIRFQGTCAASRSNEPELLASFPREIQAVLRLPAQVRRCFVLRILVGLSRPVCARLLQLSCRQVDEYTSRALKRLPSLVDRSNRRPWVFSLEWRMSSGQTQM